MKTASEIIREQLRGMAPEQPEETTMYKPGARGQELRRLGPDALRDNDLDDALQAVRWLWRRVGERFTLKDGARLYIKGTHEAYNTPDDCRADIEQVDLAGVHFTASIKAVPLCRALEAHCPGWWRT